MQSKFKVATVTFTLALEFALCTFALAQSAQRFTPYSDALPIFDALRADLLPTDLRDRTPAEREARWPAWIRGHDAAIRARVQSSETSLAIGFAVEQALDAMKTGGALRAGTVRRAAIVGPGLDTQTIQPFALIDSLLRLDLAEPDRLEVVAFDVNPRVLQHLDAARRANTAYTIVLPRVADRSWTPELADYWEQFGNWIGDPVPRAQARAVAIRPRVVTLVTSVDLNIVTERPGSEQAPFDLVVATNVLGAYDVFDQSLAAANIADMLRASGVLLTNTAIVQLPGGALTAVGRTDVGYVTSAGSGPTGDRVTWYRRSG